MLVEELTLPVLLVELDVWIVLLDTLLPLVELLVSKLLDEELGPVLLETEPLCALLGDELLATLEL